MQPGPTLVTLGRQAGGSLFREGKLAPVGEEGDRFAAARAFSTGGLMISLKQSLGRRPGLRSRLDKKLDFPDQKCKTPVQAVAITS
jgi:hypothetical protein